MQAVDAEDGAAAAAGVCALKDLKGIFDDFRLKLSGVGRVRCSRETSW